MKMASWVAALSLATTAAFSSRPAIAALPFSTVNVSGRPAGDPLGPELGPGIDWTSSTTGMWRINAAGQVVFLRDLPNPGPDLADHGLWRWAAGSKELVVRVGDPAPGQPAGVNISTVRNPGADFDLADDGSLLAWAGLTGPGVSGANDTGFLLYAPDNSGSTLIRGGAAAAGLAPLTIVNNFQNGLAQTLLSPDGGLAFYGILFGPGVNASNDFAFFSGTTSGVTRLIREGAVAPGLPVGSTIGSLDLASLRAAGNKAVFDATVINPNATQRQVIFLADSGGIAPLVTSDGTPSEGPNPFGDFNQTFINSAGDVSFRGVLANSFNRQQGFYKVPAGGGVQTVAVVDGTAPGTTDVFARTPFELHHHLTQSGAIAFQFRLVDAPGDPSPSVTDANDDGLWINDASGTRLALREGDAAADLAGVAIGQLERFAFNSQQNMVVLSQLAGNVTAADDQALWWVKPDGALEVILRAGDPFDVDPTSGVDLRTISAIKLDNVASPPPAQNFLVPHVPGVFNDANELAFALDFTNGTSGLFVTTLVPEPASALLLLLGVVTVFTIHRRNAIDLP